MKKRGRGGRGGAGHASTSTDMAVGPLAGVLGAAALTVPLVARFVHGSEDSTDLDVMYMIPALPAVPVCHRFCEADPAENRNLIVVREGRVHAAFKGLPDEVRGPRRVQATCVCKLTHYGDQPTHL